MGVDKNNISGLESWKIGDPIRAKKLQQPVTVLRSLAGVAQANQKFDPQRRILQMKQFKVVSVKVDFILCHTFDGVAEGTDDIKVAMTFLLRKTPFDGQTRANISYTYTSNVERTASKAGEDDEEQVIVDSYETGDIIYATRGIFGGTAVYADDPTNQIPVIWLDDNRDGRYWAKKSAE